MDRRRDRADEGPLHILCYIHAVDLGGVERAAVRLCGAWAETTRVTLALGRGAAPASLDDRVAMHVAPRLPVCPDRWETLWMILWLPGVIRRARPDVLFCAGNTYTVVAVVMKLLLGSRCPPIVTKVSNSLDRPDLPAPVRRLHAIWCRLQGRVIDAVVGMTPEMTREACGKLGVSTAQVRTIPSPLFDADTLVKLAARPARRAAPGRLLVAIGRLEPQKNLPLLLAAFARLPADDHLAIVGEGSERRRLAATIARMGLGDRVTMAGHCDDVAPWLMRADALVLSSDYEGVPAVVLEAMAAGLPVVATDCCASMADMLSGGRGVLVSRRDPAALAAALATLPPIDHDPVAQRAFAYRHGVREAAAAYLPLFRALAAPADAPIHQEHAFS